MIRRSVLSLLLCIVLSLPGAARDAHKTLRLASLEWLPYAGKQLDHDGWAGYVVESAAREFGYRVKVDYFPWTRALQLGTKDPEYAGVFPAYYTEERARTCHFSAPIGSSTLGLAYLKTASLRWNELQDLTRLKVGVVAGYSNGAEFDAMVREGKLKVDVSHGDVTNLRKLLARRVDAIVIDKLVLRYLLATEPVFATTRRQFAFHDKPIAELSLHVCFQRTPQGQELQQAFDRALQSLQLRKLEAEFFQSLERRQ